MAIEKLRNVILEAGPTAFDTAELASCCRNLFEERAALFYTPTASLPKRWVGAGPLEVTLPLVTPTELEVLELGIRWTPRFWTHLLQAHTGFIRWKSHRRARVVHTRFDTQEFGVHHLVAGAKALTDSLKASTTGRSDGRVLYYFGAIEDDSPRHIEYHLIEELVSSPSEARVHVSVQPL